MTTTRMHVTDRGIDWDALPNEAREDVTLRVMAEARMTLLPQHETENHRRVYGRYGAPYVSAGYISQGGDWVNLVRARGALLRLAPFVKQDWRAAAVPAIPKKRLKPVYDLADAGFADW